MASMNLFAEEHERLSLEGTMMATALAATCISLFIVDVATQMLGLYLLWSMKSRLKNQRIILASLSLDQIAYGLLEIYVFSEQIILDFPVKHVNSLGMTYISATLNMVYPIIMHHIAIDRFMEVYLNLKYPLYVTKKQTLRVIALIWFGTMVLSVGAVITQHVAGFEIWDRTAFYLFPLMDASFLITAFSAYSYICFKMREFRRQDQIRGYKYNPGLQRRHLLIPTLIVVTYLIFEMSGSVIMVVLNTVKYHREKNFILRCCSSMFFATGGISDALVYIFLQRELREKLRRKFSLAASFTPRSRTSSAVDTNAPTQKKR